jgi:hypothetical protein
MKLTKDKLKSIVLEVMTEYDLPGIDDTPDDTPDDTQDDTQDDTEDSVETKQALKEKFKYLYQNITKVKGLEKKELEIFDTLLDTALKAMQDGSALPTLKMALSKLGE